MHHSGHPYQTAQKSFYVEINRARHGERRWSPTTEQRSRNSLKPPSARVSAFEGIGTVAEKSLAEE